MDVNDMLRRERVKVEMEALTAVIKTLSINAFEMADAIAEGVAFSGGQRSSFLDELSGYLCQCEPGPEHQSDMERAMSRHSASNKLPF